jgi:hypothetical protein
MSDISTVAQVFSRVWENFYPHAASPAVYGCKVGIVIRPDRQSGQGARTGALHSCPPASSTEKCALAAFILTIAFRRLRRNHPLAKNGVELFAHLKNFGNPRAI